MSRHFELLNYSEHGTVVDNVVYCCDLDVDAATFKPESEDVKEKKPSFQGLNDFTRRNGERMAASLTEPNEVNLFTCFIRTRKTYLWWALFGRPLVVDAAPTSVLLAQQAKVEDGKALPCSRMVLTSNSGACNSFCV